MLNDVNCILQQNLFGIDLFTKYRESTLKKMSVLVFKLHYNVKVYSICRYMVKVYL